MQCLAHSRHSIAGHWCPLPTWSTHPQTTYCKGPSSEKTIRPQLWFVSFEGHTSGCRFVGVFLFLFFTLDDCVDLHSASRSALFNIPSKIVIESLDYNSTAGAGSSILRTVVLKTKLTHGTLKTAKNSGYKHLCCAAGRRVATGIPRGQGFYSRILSPYSTYQPVDLGSVI